MSRHAPTPGSFLRFLLEGQFNVVVGFCTIAALFVAFVPVLGWDTGYRIYTVVLLALLTFTLICVLKGHKLFDQIQVLEDMPIAHLEILRQKPGEGSYNGLSIYVLENPGTLRDNLIMSVYSTISGIPQPVGFLRIVNAQPGNDLLAVAYPIPESPAFQIDTYLNQSSNRYSLFASPLVHALDLSSLGR